MIASNQELITQAYGDPDKFALDDSSIVNEPFEPRPLGQRANRSEYIQLVDTMLHRVDEYETALSVLTANMQHDAPGDTAPSNIAIGNRPDGIPLVNSDTPRPNENRVDKEGGDFKRPHCIFHPPPQRPTHQLPNHQLPNPLLMQSCD